MIFLNYSQAMSMSNVLFEQVTIGLLYVVFFLPKINLTTLGFDMNYFL